MGRASDVSRIVVIELQKVINAANGSALVVRVSIDNRRGGDPFASETGV